MASKAFPADDTTRIFFAVSLAVVAGVADTIGFLEYGQLFMSFMSGNTTRFGEAASSLDWVGVARFGSVIALFCFGAFLGTLIAAWSGPWRLSTLLVITALLLTVGLVMPQGPDAVPLHAYPVVLALGLQNATLQDEAGRSLALTYVTGTVIRFGAGLANILLHKPAPSFWIQGPLWAGLTAGAVCGGVLQHHFGEAAFLAPAALAGALAGIALVMTLLRPTSPLVLNDSAPQPDAAPDAPPTVVLPAGQPRR
ncbi:hypothetical protein ASD37_06420 [Mycobacterium sp. Root135]|uniref:YoaK family protein n=1 Tax=Mycobacterium sp. Root135 TaxID=1736457 RepID=UPI0006F6A560|nr:YoaK family protein [Mycobacterium sp. Root135]KQY09983.1 hypothetical protein ASD37_06420 [Mycobacterium sp. Root135]